MIDLSQKKINGYWDGEPIWRELTPEERLEKSGINQEVANLYLISDKLKESKLYERT